MTIETLAGQDDRWDAYVHGHAEGTVYHLSKWRRLIRERFGHESYYLMSLDGEGRIDGVLPLVRLRSRLFGDFMVSMPYFNYGGILADDETIAGRLLEAARTLGRERGTGHIEIRAMRILDEALPVRDDKVVMMRELPSTPEALWKAVGSKVRAQVRRPDREGVTVVSGGLDCLDGFYAVFSRNMRDLGTPVYPRLWFEDILRSFPERTRIVSVVLGGRAVASGFLIGHGSRLEIPWASSIREYNRLGVNMKLYWEVLKYAIEAGYEVFDFGRSTVGESTYRFKKQWGAMPEQCYWSYLLFDRSDVPAINPSNRKYALAIDLWKRLPLPVANFIGPRLIRGIP